MLNLIQVIGTALMLRSPSLTIISWTIISRYALNYSTGRVLRELIYIPLDREAKYQGKALSTRWYSGLATVSLRP